MKKTVFEAKQYIDPNTHLTLMRKKFTGKSIVHLHNYYELEIILEGEGEQSLNGSSYPLKPGVFYLVTPIDFHSVTAQGRLTIANISFDETLLSPQWQHLFINRRENLYGIAQETEKNDIETLYYMLEREAVSTDPYAPKARQQILDLLLMHVARKTVSQTLRSSTIQGSMQYIFQHFREKLTLSRIAAESGYEPHYFSALFRKETGQCLTDFITELRLNYAKTLLNSTDLPITVIGQKGGFGSQSNFFRLFKQQFGCTPTQYRKQADPSAKGKPESF
ncbi:MAG: helix-turn-helix domain-containing protein [Clostridia bacterium]|nr:helix-turn-helix domain-containing protein [Clostridia bacterium]